MKENLKLVAKAWKAADQAKAKAVAEKVRYDNVPRKAGRPRLVHGVIQDPDATEDTTEDQVAEGMYIDAYESGDAGDPSALNVLKNRIMGKLAYVVDTTLNDLLRNGVASPRYARNDAGGIVHDEATGKPLVQGYVSNNAAIRLLSQGLPILGITGSEQCTTPESQGRGEVMDENKVLEGIKRGNAVLQELKDNTNRQS